MDFSGGHPGRLAGMRILIARQTQRFEGRSAGFQLASQTSMPPYLQCQETGKDQPKDNPCHPWACRRPPLEEWQGTHGEDPPDAGAQEETRAEPPDAHLRESEGLPSPFDPQGPIGSGRVGGGPPERPAPSERPGRVGEATEGRQDEQASARGVGQSECHGREDSRHREGKAPIPKGDPPHATGLGGPEPAESLVRFGTL